MTDTTPNDTKATLELVLHLLKMASGRLAHIGHEVSTLPHEEKIRPFTPDAAIDTLVKFSSQEGLKCLMVLELAMFSLSGQLRLATLYIEHRIKELEKEGEK